MSMELDRKDIDKLTDALERVAKWSSSGSNNNNFSMNFGGVGLYISLALVAVLITICFFQASAISDLQRKYDRMQDYLNAIYAQAPQLRVGKDK